MRSVYAHQLLLMGWEDREWGGGEIKHGEDRGPGGGDKLCVQGYLMIKRLSKLSRHRPAGSGAMRATSLAGNSNEGDSSGR